MNRNKRMSFENRKEEIKKVAAKVFVEKGFSNTSMEDLIKESGLSKGGFYHYYKNTTDIIYDLMLDGIEYRNEIMKKSLDVRGKLSPDFFASEMTKKVTDRTSYMDVYVEFLLAKKRNEKLEGVFELLKLRTIEAFKSMNKDFSKYSMQSDKFDLLTFFVNAMILSSNILKGEDILNANRDLLDEIFLLILNKD